MATMVKLQTVTVGSGGASSIDFTNIPQTFTDLKVVISARGTNENFILMEFNGNTTGYSGRLLRGNGSTAASSTSTVLRVGVLNPSTYTASVFSSQEIYIPNYTSSNNKSISIDSTNENNATSNYMFLNAGLWSNTAAITSIKLFNDGGENFNQYSTATLYGIKNVTTATGTGKATGGDEIYTDGTYWYHKFTTVGTSSFTPLTALTVDYLVVAGGGGGGGGGGLNPGGGGGAGGVRCTVGATGGGGSLESALSLTAQAYTVTVGAAGTSSSTNNSGGNGGNSVFATITSTGGGGGASQSTPAGTGGSGGGSGIGYTKGSGTANQGYDGGTSSSRSSGGGGGAGAVGGNGVASTASGSGGNGITTSISGISTTYGGGGGGGAAQSDGAAARGTGGTGGGANGGAVGSAGSAATANTGGGGGGGSGGTTAYGGGAGGSGIVIVRYAV